MCDQQIIPASRAAVASASAANVQAARSTDEAVAQLDRPSSADEIVLVGRRLIAIREALPRGAFKPWVKAHCAFSVRSAFAYIGRAEGTDASAPADRERRWAPAVVDAAASPSSPGDIQAIANWMAQWRPWLEPNGLEQIARTYPQASNAEVANAVRSRLESLEREAADARAMLEFVAALPQGGYLIASAGGREALNNRAVPFTRRWAFISPDELSNEAALVAAGDLAKLDLRKRACAARIRAMRLALSIAFCDDFEFRPDEAIAEQAFGAGVEVERAPFPTNEHELEQYVRRVDGEARQRAHDRMIDDAEDWWSEGRMDGGMCTAWELPPTERAALLERVEAFIARGRTRFEDVLAFWPDIPAGPSEDGD